MMQTNNPNVVPIGTKFGFLVFGGVQAFERDGYLLGCPDRVRGIAFMPGVCSCVDAVQRITPTNRPVTHSVNTMQTAQFSRSNSSILCAALKEKQHFENFLVPEGGQNGLQNGIY